MAVPQLMDLRQVLEGPGEQPVDVPFRHRRGPAETDPGQGGIADPSLGDGRHIGTQQGRIFVRPCGLARLCVLLRHRRPLRGLTPPPRRVPPLPREELREDAAAALGVQRIVVPEGVAMEVPFDRERHISAIYSLPEMRRVAKAVNFGVIYGQSAFGLAAALGIPQEDAQTFIDDYFRKYAGVAQFIEQSLEECRRTGFATTILGRRRYLPDLLSDNRQRREMAERMALNAPIQGSAADIIKVAMLGVARALRESSMSSRMLLQVHDELVFEVAEGERDRLEELVRDQMAGAANLSVPLDVSVGVGRTWHEAGH